MEVAGIGLGALGAVSGLDAITLGDFGLCSSNISRKVSSRGGGLASSLTHGHGKFAARGSSHTALCQVTAGG